MAHDYSLVDITQADRDEELLVPIEETMPSPGESWLAEPGVREQAAPIIVLLTQSIQQNGKMRQAILHNMR